jgi:hypothetical protein
MQYAGAAIIRPSYNVDLTERFGDPNVVWPPGLSLMGEAMKGEHGLRRVADRLTRQLEAYETEWIGALVDATCRETGEKGSVA